MAESMITEAFAKEFAEEWIAAWNSHDLDRILSHYTDDFEFSSPFVVTVYGEPSGVIRGKEAMRKYWANALKRRPDLHFRLASFLVGVNTLVINCNRHDGRIGAEHFEFNADGQVFRSSAHYSQPEPG
jgi:ketosteroid isomerase-like protein